MCWCKRVSTGEGWVKGQGVARRTRPIHFGTYNIRNGQNGGLESALRVMSKANMDLGVFQETKITNSIYTHESSVYKVVAVEELSAHSGGIVIFYPSAEHLFVESFQYHGANVISFQLASGDRRWYIAGFYVAPDNTLTIE